MADGNAPDITQQLLQQQSMINAAQNGNRPPGLLWLPDADVGLKLQGLGFLGKPIAAPFAGSKKKKMDGLLNGVLDDFKKMAQSAGVMYSGNVTNGAPTSGLDGGGGSFASMVGSNRGGGSEIG